MSISTRTIICNHTNIRVERKKFKIAILLWCLSFFRPELPLFANRELLINIFSITCVKQILNYRKAIVDIMDLWDASYSAIYKVYLVTALSLLSPYHSSLSLTNHFFSQQQKLDSKQSINSKSKMQIFLIHQLCSSFELIVELWPLDNDI